MKAKSDKKGISIRTDHNEVITNLSISDAIDFAINIMTEVKNHTTRPNLNLKRWKN